MPPPYLSTVYCCDEDLAVRASGDFAVLCPDWQKQAYGIDGVIASDAPWALTSATVDFEASGVASGMVATLSGPRTAFKGSGELLAVDSVSGSTLTLRRIGKASGVGSPPGPAAGVTGVTFAVATLGPQIEEASYGLNRRFNIDADLAGRRPADMYDVRDLREAAVLTVLLQRYVAENRTERGDFPIKIGAIKSALDDVIGRLEVRWAAIGPDVSPSSVFTMRIVR